MDMLSKQLDFLSEVEKEQVSQLALFVAVYFGVWFLRCGVAAAAPYQTLVCFNQMMSYTEFNLHLGFTVISSILNHTWYLTEQWVTVCNR